MTLIGRTRARAVETLSLDSPSNRNALSAALVGELADALADAAKDDAVRAIVLTHTGNTFCAGADLRDPRPRTRWSVCCGRSSSCPNRSSPGSPDTSARAGSACWAPATSRPGRRRPVSPSPRFGSGWPPR